MGNSCSNLFVCFNTNEQINDPVIIEKEYEIEEIKKTYKKCSSLKYDKKVSEKKRFEIEIMSTKSKPLSIPNTDTILLNSVKSKSQFSNKEIIHHNNFHKNEILTKEKNYFNKLNVSSFESGKVGVITSVLEIICTFKKLFLHLRENSEKYTNKIIKSLLQMQQEMFVKELKTEDCNSVVDYFFEEINKMDPLQFFFYVLRKLNNEEGLIYEKLPQYYEDNLYEIEKKVLEKFKDEFYEGFIDNYFRKTFCLASISIFRHRCKYEDCRKTYVSAKCDNNSFLTVILNEDLDFLASIYNKYSFKQIQFICHHCKRYSDDFKIRESAIFINIPNYLIIKIKSEITVINQGKKLVYYKNSHDFNLMEIKSISIGNEKFELFGMICNSSENDNYHTIIKRNSFWLNNDKFTQLNDENFFINGVNLLFYEKYENLYS